MDLDPQRIYLALSGVLPALAVMWYFDRLDARRPEPRRTLRFVALAGALSVVPVVFIGSTLAQLAPPAGTYGNALWMSFVVAAAVEELAKLLVVLAVAWDRPEFDERMDGITYGSRAGLGFAMVENVMYLYLYATSVEGFATTYLLRALLAVPGHAIWGGLLGYFAARGRFDRRGPGIIGGYLIAVVLHGLYDAAIFLQLPMRVDGHGDLTYALLVILPLVVFGGAWVLRTLARRAMHADDADAAAMRHGWLRR